jgi:hypothetical protein
VRTTQIVRLSSFTISIAFCSAARFVTMAAPAKSELAERAFPFGLFNQAPFLPDWLYGMQKGSIGDFHAQKIETTDRNRRDFRHACLGGLCPASD